MTPSRRSKQTTSIAGFTLLEMVLAVVIISTIATIALHQLQPAGETSRQRACDAVRQLLQNQAEHHFSLQGHWPGRRLSELTAAEYLDGPLPECPCQGGRYEMSGGIVVCPTHEPSRR